MPPRGPSCRPSMGDGYSGRVPPLIRGAFPPADVEPEFVEERSPDRSGRRQTKDILGAGLAVRAIGEIEIAGAEIVPERVIALEFTAQHLRRGQRMLHTRRHVERVVRLLDGFR